MLSFTADTANFSEGDIITVDGKKYKCQKKTSTAVAITRYFWFDALWDRLVK